MFHSDSSSTVTGTCRILEWRYFSQHVKGRSSDETIITAGGKDLEFSPLSSNCGVNMYTG